jgi:DNA-binding IscR family transcriptional regulator
VFSASVLTRAFSCNINCYMKRDTRLSVALHVLLHMDEMGESVTSETLGPALRINPVVVRRTMGGLRDAGIVRSVKGHGGGWSLARSLADVTLADVYDALGMSLPLFGIGYRDDEPRCPLEQVVNQTIGKTLDDAEALVMSQLRGISLATLARDVPKRTHGKRKGSNPHA